MLIRRFQIGDEPELFAVFYSSVHGLAAQNYHPRQLAAWAPADLDTHAWAIRIRALEPFVLEVEGKIVAYADLRNDGYIDHFFVASAHAGLGFGSLLLGHLFQEASKLGLKVLTADVSATAEAFFTRYGFTVLKRNTPMLRGVALRNATMQKII